MIMAMKMLELNKGLFAQFDRLQDQNLVGEKLEEEISRSKASVEVAQQIIASAALVASTYRFAGLSMKLPPMLEE
jgi:hypothetical protein